MHSITNCMHWEFSTFYSDGVYATELESTAQRDMLFIVHDYCDRGPLHFQEEGRGARLPVETRSKQSCKLHCTRTYARCDSTGLKTTYPVRPVLVHVHDCNKFCLR